MKMIPAFRKLFWEKTMKIWFWLLLSILLLMIGCATVGTQPPYHEKEISDYWYHILYHKSPGQNGGD